MKYGSEVGARVGGCFVSTSWWLPIMEVMNHKGRGRAFFLFCLFSPWLRPTEVEDDGVRKKVGMRKSQEKG